jgi:hypothetical protein
MKRITYLSYFAFSFALGLFLLGSSLFTIRASAQTSTAPAPTAGQSQGQSQDQPLGDVARKVVHKETDPAKPKAKVFDNDNLPMQDKISVVGQPVDSNNNVASNTDAQAPVTANPVKPAGDDAAKKQEEWKSWQGKITAQKDQIDLASRELDVLQREYQLRAAEMYGDAGNRLRNSGQWDKQDSDYKQKIADKQKAIDDSKQKLDDMQEEARKAGVPSSMSE